VGKQSILDIEKGKFNFCGSLNGGWDKVEK
jgi:hypothetical protein